MFFECYVPSASRARQVNTRGEQACPKIPTFSQASGIEITQFSEIRQGTAYTKRTVKKGPIFFEPLPGQGCKDPLFWHAGLLNAIMQCDDGFYNALYWTLAICVTLRWVKINRLFQMHICPRNSSHSCRSWNYRFGMWETKGLLK